MRISQLLIALLCYSNLCAQVDYAMNASIGNANDVNNNFGFNASVDISNFGSSDGTNDIWVYLVFSSDQTYQKEQDYCFERYILYSGLDAGYNQQFYFSAPFNYSLEEFGIPAGTYNVLCVIDPGLDEVESNENNNVFVVDTYQVTMGSPEGVVNYVVDEIGASSICINANESIEISVTQLNAGSSSPLPPGLLTQTRVWFSTDCNPSLQDEELENWIAIPSLDQGDEHTSSSIITIPSWVEEGESYYIIAMADWLGGTVVFEGGFEGDNWLCLEVFVPEPIQFPDPTHSVIEEVECGFFEVDFFAPFCEDCSYQWTAFNQFGSEIDQSTSQNTTFILPIGGSATSLTISECNNEMFEQDIYPILESNCGCLDQEACNYCPTCDLDDGSCTYPGCTNPISCTYEPEAGCNDGSCQYFDECGVCGGSGTAGCTNPAACNYDLTADCDDNSCLLNYGCTDSIACNYDTNANCDDENCDYSCFGCTDALSCNYDSLATIDDSSCEYVSCFEIVANLSYDQFCDSTCVQLSVSDWSPSWASIEISVDGDMLMSVSDSASLFKLYGIGNSQIEVVAWLSDLQLDPNIIADEELTLWGLDQPIILANGNVMSCSNCGDDVEYYWKLNDEQVGTNSEVVLESTGAVILEIVDVNTGCDQESEPFDFSFVNIDHWEKGTNLSVCNNGSLNPYIIWHNSLEVEVTLLSLTGQLIKTGAIESINQCVVDLAPGAYIVVSLTERLKLIKE